MVFEEGVIKMNLKCKKYGMDILCGVEHLNNILNDRVPLGERGEALAEIVNLLVFGGKEVKVPKLDEIKFIWSGMCE